MRPKIKIYDNPGLREALLALYEQCDKIVIAGLAVFLSKHIFAMTGTAYEDIPIIIAGYKANERWQHGDARMHDVRKAGFAVHRLAGSASNLLEQTALRVAGHAIATGHMKEHGMVASDYAIKAVNLVFPGNISEAENERKWQIAALKCNLF